MNMIEIDAHPSQTRSVAAFIKRHAGAFVLGLVMLLALPAYLTAMEGQFIDMEFLTSLCGISGWGS